MSLFCFIVSMLFTYQNKHISYINKLEEAKTEFEKTLLKTQLEIQEDTLVHISREIHDNISLSLTLAKLHLNTFDWNDTEKAKNQLSSIVGLISNSLRDLNDISKGLNSENISHQGLLKVIESEVSRIKDTGLFNIDLIVSGEPIYLDNHKELIIYRIVQEGFNNIIKHSRASQIALTLHYNKLQLIIALSDNGVGFDHERISKGGQSSAGLKNMRIRSKLIGGHMQVESSPHIGTTLTFVIPLNQSNHD